MPKSGLRAQPANGFLFRVSCCGPRDIAICMKFEPIPMIVKDTNGNHHAMDLPTSRMTVSRAKRLLRRHGKVICMRYAPSARGSRPSNAAMSDSPLY